MKNKILEFYRQTSLYTDLGLYKNFIKKLPDDINELCMLQRKQIIHPFIFRDKNIYSDKNSIYGDMTKVPITRLRFEDDLFPTAISMISELLRRDNKYYKERKNENKIHITCRGEAILLASILKAKGYPARVRVGFATYLNNPNGDHWITEYYDKDRWILVDADEHDCCRNLGFDINNIPREKFIFGAEGYLGIRNSKYKENEIYYASNPTTYGIKAAIRCLFYDFHSLMNDEIFFLHLPKYIQDKNFKLTEEEYKELDELAMLLLDPNKNFDKLLEVWNNKTKYRIMSGVLNS